jgi:hypothetical protein
LEQQPFHHFSFRFANHIGPSMFAGFFFGGGAVAFASSFPCPP